MPIVGHSPLEVEPTLLDELPFKLALLRLQSETRRIINEKGEREKLELLNNLIIRVLTQIETTETALHDVKRRHPGSSIRTSAL